MSQEIEPRRITPFIQANWSRRASSATVSNFTIGRSELGRSRPIDDGSTFQRIRDLLGDFSEQTGSQFG
jgi:hypothetical protein